MYLNSPHTTKSVLWDWNGTLLNDSELCRTSINKLLAKRGMEILTKGRYQQIFTFPVKDYYIKAGFDFNRESWDTVAMEFMDHYREGIGACEIHEDAVYALEMFRNSGWKQYLISAMEHDLLLDLVNRAGLTRYFDGISGIDDHFAGGKIVMAGRFCKANKIEAKAALFIGDTLHDEEVACTMGVKCILVAGGHQSKDRLLQAGCPVLGRLNEIESYLPQYVPELI